LKEDVEVIIVDDGCNETELDSLDATVVHLRENSGCAGIPRNMGLDIARGEYITFIDADDLVYPRYILKIMEKIDNGFDYCLMSWTSDSVYVDVSEGRPEWNCSVWGIVYRKDIIGDIRFTDDRIGEDYIFNSKVLKDGMKVERIKDVLYYYRDTEGSLSKSR